MTDCSLSFIYFCHMPFLKFSLGAILIFFIFSCNTNQAPNISNIKVELQVQRFEQDFFKIDTNNVLQGVASLKSKYPVFLDDFMSQILGFTNQTNPDTLSKYLRYFIRDYRFVKDTADNIFGDFEPQVNEIKRGLQYTKYYFPDYHPPVKIITFIGPFDGFSDIITKDAFAVGLQLHIGQNFSFYKSDIAHDLFPEYIIQRFTPEYIPINAIKNVVDDIYPDKTIGRPLIEQMVEKGKRLYILDKLLPGTKESLKMGYTDKQMKDSYTNEAAVWDFFLNQDLLNTTDQDITKNYIGESPKTQELGDEAPGNIGAFIGWQITKKYMDKNPSVPLKKLLSTDNREIYNASKYKPVP